MVPSDPSTSSFPDRHARPKLSIRIRCDVSPLLPAAAFIPLRINAPVLARFPDPVEARLSIRPFTLRQRLRIFRSVSAAGLTLLAYIFKAIPEPSLGSFGLSLPPRPGFYPLPGTFNTRSPLSTSDSGTPRLSSGLRSPPGSLDPSGSKRSTFFQTVKLTLASCPIFLRSPAR